MLKWQNFLNSLATPGGNLFALLLCVAAFTALVVHILHHGDDERVVTVILSTFSGFTSALLLALRGRSTDIPAQKDGGTIDAKTNEVAK